MDLLALIPIDHVADMRALEVVAALFGPVAVMLVCLALTALAGAAGAPAHRPVRAGRAV